MAWFFGMFKGQPEFFTEQVSWATQGQSGIWPCLHFGAVGVLKFVSIRALQLSMVRKTQVVDNQRKQLHISRERLRPFGSQ